MKRFRLKPWMVLTAVLFLLVAAFFGTFFVTGEDRRQSSAVEGAVGSAGAAAVSGAGGFAASVRDFFERLFGIRDVDREYEQLKIEVQKLKAANELMQDLQLENERLSELLGFKQKYPSYVYLPARVIGKDPGSWFFYFDLNRGSEDGVEQGMMVVNERGVVGTIIDVFPTYCKVMAIIDRTSAISVVVERSRDHGMAHGSGDPQGSDPSCSIFYLPIGSEVVPGDKVVTSDFDGATIKGLPVGLISKVPRNLKLENVAELIPYVDFAHIENVLIVKAEKAVEQPAAGPTQPPDGDGGTASPDASPEPVTDGGQEEGH